MHKDLTLVLDANTDLIPGSSALYYSCQLDVQLPESISNMTCMKLKSIYVQVSPYTPPSNAYPTHVTLEVIHPGFIYHSLSNDNTLIDKHVILADPLSSLKAYTTGKPDISKEKCKEVLYKAESGRSFNQFRIKVSSPEKHPLLKAIVKLEMHYDPQPPRNSSYPLDYV